MSRNFGLNVTSGTAPGEQQRPRSYSAHDTQRAESNIIQLANRLPPGTVWPNSRSQEVEPFIDERELAANCLFFGLLAATAIFVFCVYVGYQALVA